MDAGPRSVVFLCSGGGGNLRFLVEAMRLGMLPEFRLASVITDRPCEAGAYASRVGLDVFELDLREAGQPQLMAALQQHDPAVVVSNVHRILCPQVVAAFGDRLVNLHYSLLPAFGGVIGAKPVEQALAYGARLVGATVHRVSDQLDGGTPLAQVALPVRDGDTLPLLMDAVFRAGCVVLLEAIRRMHTTAIDMPRFGQPIRELAHRQVLFCPECADSSVFHDEGFWSRLK